MESMKHILRYNGMFLPLKSPNIIVITIAVEPPRTITSLLRVPLLLKSRNKYGNLSTRAIPGWLTSDWRTDIRNLIFIVKPWPNGLARERKFSTCVYLRLRLGRACVHLRWLAMTCAHFGRDQICMQVDASFSPFGHPTQVNASWVTSINLLLANEIQDMSALKWDFCNFCVLGRKLASLFGHPSQVSTQAQLVATCDYLQVRLTRV